MATATPGSIFPGRVITVGSADAANVRAVQRRLNALGCGPVIEDGVFGSQTLDAVELFQSRSVDPLGTHLKVDGSVGPMTWAALFGTQIPEQTAARAPLLSEALAQAAGEIGVMEQPLGSNRGPRVDQYLSSVGLDPTSGHYAWCAAFVYWCFDLAANGRRRTRPPGCGACRAPNVPRNPR